jgi:hypothetical protein
MESRSSNRLLFWKERLPTEAQRALASSNMEAPPAGIRKSIRTDSPGNMQESSSRAVQKLGNSAFSNALTPLALNRVLQLDRLTFPSSISRYPPTIPYPDRRGRCLLHPRFALTFRNFARMVNRHASRCCKNGLCFEGWRSTDNAL